MFNQNFALADFLLMIPATIIIIILLSHFRIRKAGYLKYLILAWIFYLIWAFANGLLAQYDEIIYFYLALYTPIPIGICAIVFFDKVTNTHYDPIKFSIVSILSALKVVFSLEPGAIFYGISAGGSSYLTGNLKLVLLGCALSFYIGFVYAYQTFQIFRMSPNYLRKFAGLGFLGGILIICETISAILNTGYLIPIFLSIGSVLILFSFLVRPQLGFILPFRAYSLYVFETKGGIPLFTYIWDDLVKNDDLADLISPVLQGISGLLNECFQKGEIREILLSEASILITRDELYATAILANKSSPYLRDALENFNREFSLKFQNKVEYVNDNRYFESASEIFNKYFRFIPERKKGEIEITHKQKRKSEIIVTDPIKPATKSLHT